jgi:hypothetical protein
MADMGGGGGMTSMIGGIAGSVLGNATMLYGYYSAKRDKKDIDAIEKSRPWYTRPGEENQYLELSKNNAYSTQIPGQKQAEQNIQQSTQGAMNNIQNMSDNPTSSLAAINELYRKEVGAFNNLSTQQSQYYQANQDRLARALQENAKYKDQEWEYNVNMPWQRKYQNKINQYVSDRNLMQQGISTWANAASNFSGSSGSSKPMAEPTSQVNYGQMSADANSGQNQMDYNSQDANSYGGYS